MKKVVYEAHQYKSLRFEVILHSLTKGSWEISDITNQHFDSSNEQIQTLFSRNKSVKVFVL